MKKNLKVSLSEEDEKLLTSLIEKIPQVNNREEAIFWCLDIVRKIVLLVNPVEKGFQVTLKSPLNPFDISGLPTIPILKQRDDDTSKPFGIKGLSTGSILRDDKE